MGKQPKWSLVSEEELIKYVQESRSYRQLAEKLGYKKDGGSTIANLKKVIAEKGLDTSHFLGNGWNKDNYDYSLFTTHSNKKNGASTAKPLIALRGHKCENCHLETWMSEPITLQVHHINGDRSDNRLENLQLLCPNCHSCTDNYSKRKNNNIIPNEDFIQALQISNSIYQALKSLGLTASADNYARAYKLIDEYHITHLEHQDRKLPK